jgi:hypothetical protein
MNFTTSLNLNLKPKFEKRRKEIERKRIKRKGGKRHLGQNHPIGPPYSHVRAADLLHRAPGKVTGLRAHAIGAHAHPVHLTCGAESLVLDSPTSPLMVDEHR